jgi:diguanylate cyclase (GGDEF)-like protein
MSSVESVSRRALVVTAGAVVLATVILVPLSRHQLQSSYSFMPAMLSVVACFDVISVYLLVGDYRDRGDVRLLMMAWAYAWSLVLMGGYALAFPGAVTTDPPLALTRSMAPYFYVTWHTGFPLLLAVAWAPWPARWLTPTPVGRRLAVAAASVTIAVVAGLGLIALYVAVAVAHRLPVLINGLDTSRMTTVTAPIGVPLVLLALAITWYGTRRRGGPERWSAVAALVCLCDLVLTYSSKARFSLGWYCGRSLTLVAAAVVLLAMLTAFRRLKARAEHDAAIDPLTGLFNRRSAQIAFDQMVARARRSGFPLGVLSLDLDRFKQVNDRYGHETGDTVLIQVGQVLTRSSRYGDVVARVGGEEFLILLPDTDEAGTVTAAEKIRAVIADMIVPGMPDGMTASLGVTTLRKDDLTTATLLRRVDTALYQAKQTGRDSVVTAPDAGPVLVSVAAHNHAEHEDRA